MNKKILSLVLAIAGLMLVPGVQASFLIDDFSEASGPFDTVDVTSNPPLVTSGAVTTTLSTSSDFAGDRTIAIDSVSSGDGGGVKITVLPFGDGLLGVSAGSTSTTGVSTAYTSGTGTSDFLFTENSGDGLFSGFAIDFVAADITEPGVEVDITFKLTIDGISKAINMTVDKDTDLTPPIFFDYALYSNLDAVGNVKFEIITTSTETAAIDLQFDNFRAYGAAAAVPEPTAFILLASAFAACRVRQHTKRTKYIST